MSSFYVEGGRQLSGSIVCAGNKNEALPLIAAALLIDKKIRLTNVPDIGDVRTMLEIAAELGSEVSPLTDNTVTLYARSIDSDILPAERSRQIRASILFASTLLNRRGRAVVVQPGGDAIGRRRMDTHFLVFKALGAKLRVEKDDLGNGQHQTRYILEAPAGGLQGAVIHLDEASVTATENALIAAAGARGETVLVNAAGEPHVQGLCRFLAAAGVAISGIGSNILTIRGTQHLQSVEHCVGCDYIEAGSFVAMAAATHSELTITNVDIADMRMILYQFDRIGISVHSNGSEHEIVVPGQQSYEIQKDLGGAIPKIESAPWPGFPADLTSVILVAATQSRGTCLIHEKMFEARLFFVDKLLNMGAQIVLCDPHRAVVVGPSRLYGSTLSSPDIRAGMALLTAALSAEGTSLIHNIEQIDRGYQEIEQRLVGIGARIERLHDRRNCT
ncbi:MAG: UDP-N-acetylglucosamine 1-carboxyvinyltransferase [Chitinivibrionales bacterium]|nr:UDP-N-acetylglucosamine 1-carboxyvinyltransferase [Chitinivibrionales bacterium]